MVAAVMEITVEEKMDGVAKKIDSAAVKRRSILLPFFFLLYNGKRNLNHKTRQNKMTKPRRIRLYSNHSTKENRSGSHMH